MRAQLYSQGRWAGRRAEGWEGITPRNGAAPPNPMDHFAVTLIDKEHFL